VLFVIALLSQRVSSSVRSTSAFPTISVQAQLPGASPERAASSVVEPLERHLTLQFGLERNIDDAARDVEAAINASSPDLPTNLPSNTTYRRSILPTLPS
jgi:multidrug efflux pump subunit AcrB